MPREYDTGVQVIFLIYVLYAAVPLVYIESSQSLHSTDRGESFLIAAGDAPCHSSFRCES